jgi:hypothetical protein
MKNDIEIYSNPKQVFKMAKKYFGKNVDIDFSTRKNKKYMILNPDTNKWIHFGSYPYEDYTKHKDKERRERFKIRNRKWQNSPKYTPSYMSYYILW